MSPLFVSSNAWISGESLKPALACDRVGPWDPESILISHPIPSGQETSHITRRRICTNLDVLALAEVKAATLTVAVTAAVVVTAVAVAVVVVVTAVAATAVVVVVVTAAAVLPVVTAVVVVVTAVVVVVVVTAAVVLPVVTA